VARVLAFDSVIAIVPFCRDDVAVRRAARPISASRILSLFVAGASVHGPNALHCTDDFPPFVAVWYGGTMRFARWRARYLDRGFVPW